MKNSIGRISVGLLFVCSSTLSLGQVPKNKTAEKPAKKNTIPLKDVKSKEIVIEFPCSANATIFLENIFRRVNILTSTDNKVKLVTTVYYQGDPSHTDEEWLEKLELGISGSAGNVVVKSGNTKFTGTKQAAPTSPVINRRPDTAIANAIAVFDSLGNWVNRKSNIKRNVILYIPASAKLDIESKYSDITIENNQKIIKARITNGSVTMKDAEQLIVNGLYSNIYAANIMNADIDITSGKFTAKNIENLDIHSKNSLIELNAVNKATLASNSDNFDVEELGSLKGKKEYGDLRVTFLKNSFDLTGNNADLKIRIIDPGVSLIRIDNQYADLRLPVGTLKNYTVNFEGTGGNIYASFEKTALENSSFKANVGDMSAKPTSFQIKCYNCTVDFK